MDQPSDPKTLFDAIVADVETRKAIREFDNADHSDGHNNPTPLQVAAALDVMAKARELRRILQS